MERQPEPEETPSQMAGVSNCVKKSYSEKEAQKEVFVLASEEHKDFFGRKVAWVHSFCEKCGGWHIWRLGA